MLNVSEKETRHRLRMELQMNRCEKVSRTPSLPDSERVCFSWLDNYSS